MFNGRVGISKNSFNRLVIFYIAIQAVIWVKTLIFLFLFGKGRYEYLIDRLIENPFFFVAPLYSGQPVLLVDFIFHQIMHALIAISVFIFAKNAKKFNPISLSPFFALASFFHNVSYWFTNVFGSRSLIAFDFVVDIIFLYFFFYLFRGIVKIFKLEKLKFPLVE